MNSLSSDTAAYVDRLARVRTAMDAEEIDVLLLSVGADLPWLIGYEAMPLERLTMLVAHRDGDATLVVPRLEAPRVVERPGVFTIRAWEETDDPVALVAALSGRAKTAAIGDTTWARFVLELQREMPSTAFSRATAVTGALRAHKDDAEIEALRRAGAAADRVAIALQGGDIALVGRTEAEVSAELSARLLAEGHHQVNFAIVAAGENAASPHHDAGARVIRSGEVVLCDFGGTLDGYCSDITRCVSIGDPSPEVAEAYAVLFEAQAAAVEGRHHRHAVRSGRRRRPRHHRGGGLRGELHPSHGSRHRRRGARRPLHRAGQCSASRTRSRVLDRARHLRCGKVRAASRGHRGCDLSRP